MKFYFDRLRNRQGVSRPRVTVTDNQGKPRAKANFEEAFGFSGYPQTNIPQNNMQIRGSYDENIRLAPYTYGGTGRRRAGSTDDTVNDSPSPDGTAYYGTPDLGGRVQPAQSRQRGVPPV